MAGFQDAVRAARQRSWPTQEQLGIAVEQCAVQSIPPRQLKDAFDQVTQGAKNRSKVLNEAHSYENQVTNKASAEAASLINLAAVATARATSVDMQARREGFQELLPQYQDQSRPVRAAAADADHGPAC